MSVHTESAATTGDMQLTFVLDNEDVSGASLCAEPW